MTNENNLKIFRVEMSFFTYLTIPKTRTPIHHSPEVKLHSATGEIGHALATLFPDFIVLEVTHPDCWHFVNTKKCADRLKPIVEDYLKQVRKMGVVVLWGTLEQVKNVSDKKKLSIADFFALPPEEFAHNTAFQVHAVASDVQSSYGGGC